MKKHCTFDLLKRSIDHHPGRDLARDIGGEFGVLFLWATLLLVDVRLQASVEIVHAYASVDNGDHNQDERDDSEEGHRRASRQVLRERGRRVHAEELEAKVGHGCEEEKLNHSVRQRQCRPRAD